MLLRYASASPFVRKVIIAAALTGQRDQISLQPVDNSKPDEPIRSQNPLGKIPTLVLDDGTTLFDSRVILEYLDHRAGGGRIIPLDPSLRFPALRLQALADGIMDACILLIYEGRYRPAEHHVQSWLDFQAGKVARGLAALEQDPPKLGAAPNVGDIALACTLGYRDFRFQGTWRAEHPRLVAWLDEFAAKVPAFNESKPS